MEVWRKYGVQSDIYFPLIVAGSTDFAGSGDYTHASGDVKVSKDGGAAATATNSPSVIAMGNGNMWKLTLTATEMQAALIAVVVSDAATKAIDDQMIIINTYGNASGQHAFDLDTATQTVDLSTTAKNDVNAEVDTALTDIHLDHLLAADYDPASKPGVATALFNELVESDAGVSRYTANALEQAPTGGGSTATIMWEPVIPKSIDLADTKSVRMGVRVWDAIDDLPSTAEITPGTIDIDRSANGGTSWSSVVSGAACSEQAGLIYYDEVFDSGSGYAENDSIRITFYSQKVTISANDHEFADANGVSFQTVIRSSVSAADIADSVLDEALSGHTTAGTLGKAVADIAADVWAYTLEAGAPSNAQTATEFMRLFASVLLGLTNDGSGSQFVARDLADLKDRVTAAIDADGFRTSMTLDGS